MDGHLAVSIPYDEVAMKLGLTLGVGLLIGLEREWSQKEAGVRTFAITALLGTLTASKHLGSSPRVWKRRSSGHSDECPKHHQKEIAGNNHVRHAPGDAYPRRLNRAGPLLHGYLRRDSDDAPTFV
jgi:MgtC family